MASVVASSNVCNATIEQSGFDRDKFVDCKDELDEFLCAICQGIFRDPKVTQCCGQTYCHKDISQWLVAHNTCPNCRKRLSVSGLIDPPKALKNLWSKLKMRCDYSEQGCNESINLEDVAVHLSQCDYRPNAECKTCGIVRASVKDHNCIESLKRANAALKLKQIKEQVNYSRKLKKAKENLRERFRKELEELKKEVIKENEEHDKQIKRKFNAFQKNCDIDQAGPSKAKRYRYESEESDEESGRAKKRAHVMRPDSDSYDSASEQSHNSDEDQTPPEEQTDASASEVEQEESDQEIEESDSQ